MGERLAQVRERIASRSPESLLVAGFGGLIAAGTGLLSLPCSHRGRVGILDALFTATSAVCVTGLVVVDTETDYTLFGQIIIMLLIQAGGLGVMSFAALAFQILGRRLSLSARTALSSSLIQREVASEIRSIFWRILSFALITEAAGALLIFVGMLSTKGAAHAAYSATFHSISAFCNAGFGIYTDNLVGLRNNSVVISTIMVLIVLGGIGHPAAVDLLRKCLSALRRKTAGPNRLELGSSVALVTSAALILGGLVLIAGFGLAPGGERWTARIWDALFQSVTARTAGFNTVDIGALPLASVVVLILLMFVGGSPGSCAGGIKTTTFALWLASLSTLLRGEKRPRLFGRHIPGEIVRRSSLIIGLALIWTMVGLLVLLAAERGNPGVGGRDMLFELVSAFGTVGLSTGLTPKLSVVGRLWIITTMFVGRLGPLTLAAWVFTRKAPGVRYPEGRIMIG